MRPWFKILLFLLALAAAAALLAPETRAGLVRVQISSRTPFADGMNFGNTGSYEIVGGRLHFESDPADPANARIADLPLAPTNEEGFVESWADFVLLLPADPAKGNGTLLYDVHNRGNKLALWTFNDAVRTNAPRDAEHGGNGFLMRRGFSLLWTGWSGEIEDDGTDRLLGGVPVATQPDGSPVTGRNHVEIAVDAPTMSRALFQSPWGISKAFPAVSLDLAEAGAELTRRPDRDSPAEAVPDGTWSFARWEDGAAVPDPTSIYIEGGFEPGWIYDLVYTARDPRVSGLGLAGLRDTISFLRHEKQAPDGTPNLLHGHLHRTIIFGISQSGRFVHHFLYDGFNIDPEGRRVFDGALIHVAGAGKGLFNHRFGMATVYGSHREGNLSPTDFFPFAPAWLEDPISGKQGDSFGRLRDVGGVPRTLFVQSSTEYWSRAASLLHTDPGGRSDLEPDPEVRHYLIAGSQHLDGSDDIEEKGSSRYSLNPIKHRGPVLRALLARLDDWIREGTEPPASLHPRIDDGTLVDLETFRASFPKIPGAEPPAQVYRPLHLDPGPRWDEEGIADVVPPETGARYPTLVPAVDEDGNEIAGIRLPEVAVPLGTATGWNLRDEAFGAGGVLNGLPGAWFPFAETKAEREASGDPRPAVEERHADRLSYLGAVAESLLELRDGGYLLDEDVTRLLARAAEAR